MNLFAAFHIPHSSSIIPEDLRGSILLSDEELRVELLRMTDWYTDELFDVRSVNCAVIHYPISRLVLDPERFLDEAMEPMADKGMGVIYTRSSDGKQLRCTPSRDTRESLIRALYVPHHLRLSRIVASMLRETGQALVIDCHSFPSFPLPYEDDQSGNRPEVCLGTDPFHTPSWLGNLASSLFTNGGFSVDVNRPFSGALVPIEYYRTDARVHAIMVEVNRGLYMNEHTGDKKQDFVIIKERMQTILRELVDAAAERVKGQHNVPPDRLRACLGFNGPASRVPRVNEACTGRRIHRWK